MDLLFPRAPSTFSEAVWGGCQEGPVIPSEEALGALGIPIYSIYSGFRVDGTNPLHVF